MHTARFAYLLFDKIVSKAAYLEVILHLGINVDNSLTYLHLRYSCDCVDLGILVKLIKDKNFFLDGALIDAKEQILSHLCIVHYFLMHRHGCLIFSLSVFARKSCRFNRRLINHNQDLAQN